MFRPIPQHFRPYFGFDVVFWNMRPGRANACRYVLGDHSACSQVADYAHDLTWKPITTICGRIWIFTCFFAAMRRRVNRPLSSARR
jgi:hypothetical protein